MIEIILEWITLISLSITMLSGAVFMVILVISAFKDLFRK